MPTNDDKKAEALYLIDVAREILPETTSVDDVIAAAKKLAAFLNEDDVSSTIDEVAAEPEVKRVEFWRVEYTNRKSAGTHWGKPYKTEKGANKNTKNPAFLRAVRFVETD